MAIYENEHVIVMTKDDDTRYQITTFRDVSDSEGGTEVVCAGSATAGELLTAIKRLSEVVITNGVKLFAEEFGGSAATLEVVLKAFAVKRRLARDVLDAAARGCGLDTKDVEVKSWPMELDL